MLDLPGRQMLELPDRLPNTQWQFPPRPPVSLSSAGTEGMVYGSQHKKKQHHDVLEILKFAIFSWLILIFSTTDMTSVDA